MQVYSKYNYNKFNYMYELYISSIFVIYFPNSQDLTVEYTDILFRLYYCNNQVVNIDMHVDMIQDGLTILLCISRQQVPKTNFSVFSKIQQYVIISASVFLEILELSLNFCSFSLCLLSCHAVEVSISPIIIIHYTLLKSEKYSD